MSSTTIDEKVVSIQFDNAKFERNVSTTMSTLDKLKQKLNFDGASKGMQDISNAASKMDFKPMSSAVEQVGVKFNGLWTIADQTLRNITNSVESTAKRMIAAFTTDPIKTGFNEYELKMGSVQTIMASTGESLETVNRYLEELNKYSDKTIYSFSDMTQNIGKFTNAGVKLEDAVAAIKGISNEAAVSGANANEASRAMYNFSQALSAGYVKLIDWKSIENANMATVEFKETLLEAAVAAGTVEKTSDGMYKVLTQNNMGSTMEQAISATKNFNDSLGYQWMTTDALVSALEIYATDVREMTDAEVEAYRARLRNKGYTEEQIKAAEELGIKAADAATEVKTFTMLMDTLKEAAQSGWAQTWELIVGDFNEAKELWTEVNEVLGGLIDQMSTSRNELLGGALNSNWEKFTKEINEAGLATDTYLESVRETAKAFGKTDEEIDLLIEKHGSLGEAIAAGAFDTRTLVTALNNVKKSMIDLSDVTEDLKEGATGDDVKKIQEALKKAGFQCGEFGEALDGVDGKFGKVTESAVKAFQEANGLEVTGIVDEKTLRALEKASGFTGELSTNVYKLIGDIDKLGGRQLLIESIKNAFKAVSKVLGSVKKAWNGVFKKTTSAQLYDVIVKINEFTKSLSLSDDNLQKVQDAFEGFFSVVKFVKDILVTVAKEGLKLGWNILKPMAKIVLDVASAMGKLATKLFKTSSDSLDPFADGLAAVVEFIGKFAESVGEHFTKAIDFVSDFATTAIEHFLKTTDTVKKTFSEWKKAMQETELFQKISGYIETGAEAIRTALDTVQSYIDQIDFSTITTKAEDISQFFIGISTAIGNSEFLVSIVDGIVGAFSALINVFDGINFKLPSFDDIANFFTGRFAKLVKFLSENEYSGFFGTIKGTFAWIKSLFEYAISTKKNDNFIAVAEFFNKVGDGIVAGFQKAKEIFAAIKEFIFGTEEVKLADIMSTVTKILAIVLLIESIKAARAITNVFGDVTSAIDNVAKSLKWRAVGDAFKSISIAIGAFALCIFALSKLTDVDKAWQSAGMLLLLLGVMGGVIAGLMFLSNKLDTGFDMAKVTLTLLAFAGATAILVWTLKYIDQTDFRNLGKSLGVMVSVMAALALSIGILGKLCGGSAIKAVGAITTMLIAAKMIPEVLQMYAEYPWQSVTRGIPAMVAVLGGLAIVCRMMTVTAKEGSVASSSAGTILATVAALVVIIWAMKSLAEMPEDDLWRSVKAVSVLMAVLGIMAVAMKAVSMRKLSDGVLLTDTSRSFSGIATALLAVAASIFILGKMDVDTLKQGGIATVAILAVFTGMMSAIGKAGGGASLKGAVPMLITMGAIIAVMYFVVRDLAKTDWRANVAAASAMGVLLTTMVGSMRVLARTEPIGVKKVIKWTVMLAAITGVIWALSGILRQMDGINPTGAITNATALSALLLAMTGCLRILSQKNTYSNVGTIYDRLAAFVALSGVIIVLAACLGAMDGLDPVGAIANATALSALLLVMTGCMKVLAGVSKGVKANDLLKTVGIFTIFGLITAAVGGILWELKALNIDGGQALGQVSALTTLLLGMSACIVVLSKIGVVGATAIWPALGALAAFAAGLVVILSILGGIEELSKGGFGKILDNAVTIMQKIGDAIGALVGGIVGGVGTAISSTLPQLGKDLSDFMTNAQVFFDGLKNIDAGMVGKAALLAPIIGALEYLAAFNGIANVLSLGRSLPTLGEDLGSFFIQGKPFFDGLETLDDSTVAAAKVLAETIMLLTASEFIDGISKMLGMGISSFADFGTELAGFGASMKMFSESVADLDDGDLDRISIAAEAGKKLAEFSEALPKEGGWAQKIFGQSDMATFGKQASSFGDSLVAFADSVSQLTDKHVEAINRAADAGGALATLAGKIPNEGGWAATIMGENDMATFGKRIVAFGHSLVEYGAAVKDITKDDAKRITSSAEAGTALATLAGSIPNEGGWAAEIMGENDMADFGKKIVAFGEGLVDYATIVADLDDDDITAINKSKECADALAMIANSIPKTDSGWWGDIAGESNLADFGNGMSAIARGMKNYSTVAKSITEDDITAIELSEDAIKAMGDVAKAVPDGMQLFESNVNTDSLAGFSTGMTAIAGSIQSVISAARMISAEDVTEEGPIYRLKSAIIAMSDAAKAIPNEGGLVSLIAGDNANVATFGSGMVTLTGQIKNCIFAARGVTEEDVAANGPIQRLRKAITALSAAAKAIPNEGGLVSLIAGDNADVATFGSGMVTLTGQIKNCLYAARGITEDDVDKEGPIYRLKKAITALADAAKAIPNEGGLVSLISGDNADMATFGSGILTLTGQIKNCIYAARGITEEDIAEGGPIARFKTALNQLQNAIPTEFIDNTAAVSTAVYNIEELAKSVASMSSVDASATDGFVSAVNNLGNISIDGLNEAISGASDKISTSFVNIIKASITAVNTQQPKFNVSGGLLMGALIEGITSKAASMKTPILSGISSCVSAVKQNWQSMYTAGTYLGSGLVSGINSKWQAAYDAGYALGQAAVQGEKDGQQSNSPSKATIQAGHCMGEGLVIGLKDMGKKVYNAGHNMGEKASDSISGALYTAMELLSGDMDSQPTIRPVLDLSDIQAGAGAINGMFGLRPSVGLLTNVGAINASMNRRNQNGVNADVVSAINKLHKDIGELQGNVYNINGITYDDGSNIVDAVQTLVRAARQGGRV